MSKSLVRKAGITTGRRTHLTKHSGNTMEGRRFQDLLDIVEAERGGRANMTAAQQSAARQWVALNVAMELMQADLATGKPVDLEALGQLGDRADRQIRRMGPPSPKAKQSLRDQLLQRADKR